MSYPKIPSWNYSVPASLLLMAPFDILASLAMDIYLPVVPTMPQALGTSPEVIQLTLSLYMLVLGVGQIVFGPISDIVGRRPVLLGGAALFAFASFLLAGASSALLFVALRLLQAIGASAALVATFATVRDVYAERPESSVIYSLLGSLLSLVPAFGPIVGAVIADHYGWRAIFLVIGLLSTVAILNAGMRWHETCPATTATSIAIRPILASFSFWIYTTGFSAAMGAFFVFFSTAPRILIDRAGFSGITFSFIFASVALVMIVTARFASRFVTRWASQAVSQEAWRCCLSAQSCLAQERCFRGHRLSASSCRCGSSRSALSLRQPSRPMVRLLLSAIPREQPWRSTSASKACWSLLQAHCS
ncbi:MULTISPECIES: CmlA/FloR family chloramphenicol efflux MFS transporter [unclassified Rhizobium]|uniref:CmlA/FloR family chloramphenicol efflux MFS transporter n=1 Tax=unclassified Rhizobium TaxID=2613769 RepID=UPI001FD89E30|nr:MULTISPECIES: CmlA/FloR family chloramphenicol efflux MFS transporter [unclassified Rhizobium]